MARKLTKLERALIQLSFAIHYEAGYVIWWNNAASASWRIANGHSADRLYYARHLMDRGWGTPRSRAALKAMDEAAPVAEPTQPWAAPTLASTILDGVAK